MIGSCGGSPRFCASAGHPGGDLLLRRVVAGVGAGRVDGHGGRVGDGRDSRGGRVGDRRNRSAAAAGSGGGSTAFRNAIDSLPERFFWAAAASSAVTAFMNSCDSFGGGGGGAATAAGAPGTAATAGVPGTAAAAATGVEAISVGGFQSGEICSLKPMCRWFWCAASVK